ncbi:MAG TPA: copper chaperone PCu(A)C [Thalassobaculum sp.]
MTRMTALALAAALILPLPALAQPAPSQSAPSQSGAIQIVESWARASAGAAKNGAAYLTIVNAGDAADRLVSASTPAAGTAELHTHIQEGEVMRMRPIEAIEVPAGATVRLAPGRDHLMLMGLREPLSEGGAFPLTLVFEKAGSREVEVSVKSVGAMDAGSGHEGNHGGHHKH